jgi:D-alanyl-D-alanine carboxypeptidase
LNQVQLPPLPHDYEARMPRHEEAQILSSVGRDTSGRDALLTPSAAAAWLAMQEGAAKFGNELLVISAFRSIARQRTILESKLEAGVSWSEILAVSAYPGFSEHHTGRAVDIGAPGCEDLTEQFEVTDQFKWLSANAQRFGFSLSYPRNNRFGIIWEPWHWCFS